MNRLKKVLFGVFSALFIAQSAFGAIGFKNDSYGNIIGRSSEYLSAGETSNCNVSISGSTLSVVGDNGNALSSDNPCIAGLISGTTGRTVRAVFKSPISVTFGSSSDTDGNDWGVTNSVNWTNTMPFILEGINDGTNSYLVIARAPYRVSGAAASSLCQKGDTDCDAVSDQMILTTGLTLASWVNLPTTPLGWINAAYATSGNAWTFSTSLTDRTGFNKFWKYKVNVMELGQMGAATGTYVTANGGTAPLFTDNFYEWVMGDDGHCRIALALNGDPGTDGAGAVQTQVILPLPFTTALTIGGIMVMGDATGATTITNTAFVKTVASQSSSVVQLNYNSAATTNAQITNAMFSNGARAIRLAGQYRCY